MLRDPERKQKVLQLRDEKIPGLLTTTILERGITIKNVQVAVVGAESTIFTASALISNCGTCRKTCFLYEWGMLFYVHHGVTLAMDEARQKILANNKEGSNNE
ncbi:DNA/RNA helicase OS=Lysinibacillus sphaericus OX=1421 GN=LS41612_19625 PE=4 SV=1 [Lysinibacillus sphaericus]